MKTTAVWINKQLITENRYTTCHLQLTLVTAAIGCNVLKEHKIL
jgi:hypothetical protein